MAKSTPSKPKAGVQKTTEQEKFERDLQALAAKAKEQTTSKWALSQLSILLQSAILISLAATYANVSQLALSPVYGSIPSSIYHDKVVVTALFLGWSLNLYFKRLLPIKPALLLPVIAVYIPIIQHAVSKYSNTLGGKLGPLVTEILTLFPLLFISISCTGTLLDDLELRSGRQLSWLSDALPGISYFLYFKGIEYFSNEAISSTIGKTFLHTRLGLQILLSGLYSLLAPSKLLLLTLPGVLHTAFLNTHVPLPYHTDLLNNTLRQSGWSLLDRKESVTGYMSIVESSDKGFRVMRCDHSLLGGEWMQLVTKTDRREPIYGIFVMLEAVRLIEVPEPVADKDAKALVIGLGIGTTPTALHTHGINTTIVEIDPVVHEFAVKYFDFPPEINARLTDAITYASDLAQEGVEKFDYIVHDVFTGGAEPVDLFTVEFISDLKALLEPNGVIAINFAGDLLLPSARIVIHTILSIFKPTHCRIYRESEATTAETVASNSKLDFTNMVIFCLNSPTTTSSSSSTEESTKQPEVDLDADDATTSQEQITSAAVVKFRLPVVGDLLNSPARRAFLVPKHEIAHSAFGTRAELEDVGGLLYRKDARERFKAWHESSAVGHWGVMRVVLPAQVWIMW